jgi:hypothetical protein
MTQLHVSPETDSIAHRRARAAHGWLVFAGVMFLIGAAANALWGISALVNDDYFSADELLFGDLSLWGALYLGFAALLALTGVLIIRASDVGMILGTVLASLHFLLALLTIGAYPLWTVLLLVIDGLIIYGLLVHGPDETRGV